MRWLLRGVLAAQVAFFAIWGRSLLMAYEPGQSGQKAVATVWLATEPVDPRDLLSGNFLALRYEIADPGHTTCMPLVSDRVYVELAPSGTKVATAEGEVEISRPVACRAEPPPRGDGRVWIVGRRGPGSGGERLVYGIEKMFVSESSPLRTVKSGDVVAKVAVNEAFAPRLLGLVATSPGGAAQR